MFSIGLHIEQLFSSLTSGTGNWVGGPGHLAPWTVYIPQYMVLSVSHFTTRCIGHAWTYDSYTRAFGLITTKKIVPDVRTLFESEVWTSKRSHSLVRIWYRRYRSGKAVRNVRSQTTLDASDLLTTYLRLLADA